jgi:hypothetical protein
MFSNWEQVEPAASSSGSERRGEAGGEIARFHWGRIIRHP